MQMWATGAPRHAHLPDHLARLNSLARTHPLLLEMAINVFVATGGHHNADAA